MQRNNSNRQYQQEGRYNAYPRDSPPSIQREHGYNRRMEPRTQHQHAHAPHQRRPPSPPSSYHHTNADGLARRHYDLNHHSSGRHRDQCDVTRQHQRQYHHHDYHEHQRMEYYDADITSNRLQHPPNYYSSTATASSSRFNQGSSRRQETTPRFYRPNSSNKHNVALTHQTTKHTNRRPKAGDERSRVKSNSVKAKLTDSPPSPPSPPSPSLGIIMYPNQFIIDTSNLIIKEYRRIEKIEKVEYPELETFDINCNRRMVGKQLINDIPSNEMAFYYRINYLQMNEFLDSNIVSTKFEDRFEETDLIKNDKAWATAYVQQILNYMRIRQQFVEHQKIVRHTNEGEEKNQIYDFRCWLQKKGRWTKLDKRLVKYFIAIFG
jgi:hypothetical protein